MEPEKLSCFNWIARRGKTIMRLSDIDLRLLRVFKSVAESGGFVKAQAALGISQPAISSHIANLEQRLNVRLCNRGPQGFSLTPQGQEVLTETNQMLDHLDAYANRLNEIGEKTEQRIRIGVVDCLVTDPQNPLPEAIKQVKAQQKSTSVRIGVYDYLDCLTELRAGRLDIAIVGIDNDEKLPEEIEAVHIYDELSGLYCAPDHACSSVTDLKELTGLLNKAEISAHSFLMNPIDDSFEMHLLEENAGISQGNIESTTYLTLAGTHVGLIPKHYADQWVNAGRMVAIAPDTYGVISRFHAVRIKSAVPSQVAQQIWDQLKS
jgi:DNA-binding transcriptional LysR family regulator